MMKRAGASTLPVGIPTMTETDGKKEWRLNGLLHREDGPAVDGPDGKMWYLHGILHREDGPAVEGVDDDEGGYLNDMFQTEEDEPRNKEVYKAWYLNGEKLSEEEYSSRTTMVKRAI
jgi:hypothetical protein